MISLHELYYVVILIGSLILTLLASYTWSLGEERGARVLATLLMFLVAASILFMLPLIASSDALAEFWVRLRVFTLTTSTVLFSVFMFWFVGWIERGTLWKVAPLFVVPVVVGVLSLTNDWHHLIILDFHRAQLGNGFVEVIQFGGWVPVILVYSYLNVVVAIGIAIYLGVKASGQFRLRLFILILAVFAPWVMNIPFLVGDVPHAVLNFTPVGITLLAIMLKLVMINEQLFAVTPIALDVIFREMNDAVIVLDAQKRITALNRAGKKVFNQSGPIIGHPVQRYFSEKVAFVGSSGRFEHTCPQTTLVYDVTYTPITSSSQERVIGYIVTMHDMTERKRAEAREAQLTREYGRSEALTEMSRHISHDLRTPLATIYTALHIARKLQDEPDRMEKRLEIIDHHAHKIERILDEFQLITQLEGMVKLTFQRLPVDDILRAAYETLRGEAEDKQLRFTHDLQAKTVISAEPTTIRTAFEHLLYNAIIFTPVDGSIHLCSSIAPDGRVRVDITDTGVGIAPDQLDRIFKPFYKANTARTGSDNSGAGLGLTIVQRVIRLHLGEIHIESTVGRGTTVSVILPPSRIDFVARAEMMSMLR